MNTDATPTIYASKCLGFDKCRYNGVTIYDDFIEKLKPHVSYITACPEVDIGLGVPRDPVRIVVMNRQRRLVQPATGRDVTDAMMDTTEAILGRLPDIDGFILKSRSPSCGIKDTKYFPKMEKSAAIGKAAGFFGEAVLARFKQYPIEDEGRIRNFRIREHFLSRVFTLARFRTIDKHMGALVEFHTAHKLLLMAYSQKEMKLLGSLVANHEKLPVEQVFRSYRAHLLDALLKPPKYTSSINVVMHEFGYFSKHLSQQEKDFFFASLERYRSGKIPLSAVLAIINAWIARFNVTYLAQQVFFEPYPQDLLEITDSGKGRNLSK
jgi:uncharacterized protein YbgA (DUF1722 family)/uncharacterized protein YbbK (DUF523 family)